MCMYKYTYIPIHMYRHMQMYMHLDVESACLYNGAAQQMHVHAQKIVWKIFQVKHGMRGWHFVRLSGGRPNTRPNFFSSFRPDLTRNRDSDQNDVCVCIHRSDRSLF